MSNPFAGLNAFELRQMAAGALANAAELERAEKEAERAAREARRPKMPRVDENAPVFVAFAKYMSGRNYTYAAVGWRVGPSVRWSVTGQDQKRFNWPGLLAFIGEANWSTLVPLEPVGEPFIKPDDEPPVGERMGRFGRVLDTLNTVDPFVRAEVPRYGQGKFAGGGYVSSYGSQD